MRLSLVGMELDPKALWAMRVYLEESFAGTVLHDLGFECPHMAAQRTWGVKLTSKESIPSMNADVMFVIFQSQDGAVHENYQSWSGHPLSQHLDAARNDQLYQHFGIES